MVRTSSKWGRFWLSSYIWHWRSRSISPQNNRDLNQGLLHFWSQFGDPSKWLTHKHTDRHTDAGNDNTQRPKLASGKNIYLGVNIVNLWWIADELLRAITAGSFNSSPPSAAYMRQWIGSALIKIMACHLFGAKPLSKPMLGYCQLESWNKFQLKFYRNTTFS